jgi:tRNA A37 threonylcarbamoyladenosine dehydratase
MAFTLAPRTYFVVDRVSKLVALLLVVAGLGGVGGSLAPVLALVGFVVGMGTIFVEVEK